MVIRDFRFDDSDYQAMVALMQKITPYQLASVGVLRWADAIRPNVWWQKRVAEVDGQFAALGTVGEPFWSLQEGKIHLSVEVDPDYLNRGIGTRLFADLEALARARGPLCRLVTSTQEDKTAASDFLGNGVLKWPSANPFRNWICQRSTKPGSSTKSTR